LSICGAGGGKVVSNVDGENYSVNLNLSVGYQSSQLFGSAPEEIITFLKTKNVTFNHHQLCVSTDEYHNNQALKKFYRLLSTNRDKEGKKQFVSTIEGNILLYKIIMTSRASKFSKGFSVLYAFISCDDPPLHPRETFTLHKGYSLGQP